MRDKKQKSKQSEWTRDSTSVKVALRVRPLLPREIKEGNDKCI